MSDNQEKLEEDFDVEENPYEGLSKEEKKEKRIERVEEKMEKKESSVNSLIRVAYNNPSLRDDLIPAIKKLKREEKSKETGSEKAKIEESDGFSETPDFTF